MTFRYKRDEIYIGCAKTNSLYQIFRKLSYYKRTVCLEKRDQNVLFLVFTYFVTSVTDGRRDGLAD